MNHQTGLSHRRHRNGIDQYWAARPGTGAQSVLYGQATRDRFGLDAASTSCEVATS
jgi:hypothetical protein